MSVPAQTISRTASGGGPGGAPNAYLLKSTVAPALGGLLFGFDTAVMAGTNRDLTAIYHLSAWSLGLTVAPRSGAPSWGRCSRDCQATDSDGATVCG